MFQYVHFGWLLLADTAQQTQATAATAGGAWGWLTPELLGLAVAALTSYLRMEVALANLREKVRAAENRANEDRKALWDAVTVIRGENSECTKERGALDAKVEMLVQQVDRQATGHQTIQWTQEHQHQQPLPNPPTPAPRSRRPQNRSD